MDLIELKFTVRAEDTETATAIATFADNEGLYIEDYSNLEADLSESGLYDYIGEDLLAKDREHSVIHIYAADQQDAERLVREMTEGFARENIPFTCDSGMVYEKDWSEKWKEFYKPIHIEDRIVVCPSWMDTETKEGEKKLILDPGMAFGTGQHETTRLCLEKLCALDVKDRKIMDMGCGSGILGIASLLLGADSLTAIDVDDNCIRVTRENAEVNGVDEKLRVRCGDVLEDSELRGWAGDGYDIILANIVADVIIMYKEYFRCALKEGGHLITGGIIEGRENEVIEELMSAGFSVDEIRKEKNWFSISFV